MNKRPLRLAIIGTAKRSDYLYGPIIKALPSEVELVSVWGRSAESAERLGKSLQVPAYTDVDKLVRETAPEIAIVSVNYHANGEVGLMALQAGLHVLLETPIAHKLSEADAIIAAAGKRGLKVEIAEQFHRRPLEQIKLKLIASGICEAEGIPLEEYINLLGMQGKNYEKWLCENIRSGSYGETSAPLELWAGGIQQISQHARDSHINADFPQLAAHLFQQAMDAGYGREEVSALFKVLKRSA